MAIKPILFNTEMVRAILDGRKTCTRRLVKTRRKDAYGFYVTKKADGTFSGIYEYDENESMFDNPLMPPYRLGDILYVRETWCEYGDLNGADQIIDGTEKYYYRADGENPTPYNYFLVQKNGYDEHRDFPTWHPSIHMPKAAVRIWLKVTDVRLERLHDITDDGAKAEGANWKNGKNVGWEEKMRRTAVERFAEIWESTIKKTDKHLYGWDANPWVWVIEFERCEKP